MHLMKVLKYLSQIILCTLAATAATSSDAESTMTLPATYALSSARAAAAEADMTFFTIFFDDFNANLASYTSYMNGNNMQLPQEFVNYYYHLAGLPSTANLEADLASSFPFTPFQTFITKFPWYSSLLTDASASTLYLPQYFITASSNANNIGTVLSTIQPSAMTSTNISIGNATRYSTTGTVTSSTSSSAQSSLSSSLKSTESTNGAVKIQVTAQLILLVFVGFFP